MSDISKALLIGGAGFIGSYIAERLIKENHNVIIADNLLLGSEQNIHHLYKSKQIRFIRSDFSVVSEVQNIFEQNNFDIVFHFAANSDIQASAKDPGRDLYNTFLTTFYTLECMRKYNVKKLVFASTSAIYGDKKDLKIGEDIGPLFPISYYGAAKMSSEAFISAYCHMNNIEAWICRFPNVIGGRSTHGVVHDFINKLRNNSIELEILGDGNQSKPYLYVEDLVEAIFFVFNHSNELINYYNIGVESQTSVRRIADIICEEMELKLVEYKFTGGNIGWKGDVPAFQYDLSKIHALGWKAKYTSDESVRISVRRILKDAVCNPSRG